MAVLLLLLLPPKIPWIGKGGRVEQEEWRRGMWGKEREADLVPICLALLTLKLPGDVVNAGDLAAPSC